MNKNNGVSRFAERAGWCVTILTFFGGTIFLQLRQEANHQDQIVKIQSQAKVSSNVRPLTYTKKKYSIDVDYVTLPPPDSNLGHAFWVSERLNVMTTEVSKALYSSVMYEIEGEDIPMEFSAVNDVLAFANHLSVKQGLKPCYRDHEVLEKCSGWRVPTDNEWMLFANAGQGTKYSGSDVFDDVGWDERSSYQIASKPPNCWGMHDMSGGAREVVFNHKEGSYGLLGDQKPLNLMHVQALEDSFAVRLVRDAPIESQRF